MAVDDINIGTVANDRTGDKPRTAFSKVNAAFVDLRALITAFGTGANLMLLDAIQTVTGKKTFTQQIESTVVTGTAPLKVASETEVANFFAATSGKVEHITFSTAAGNTNTETPLAKRGTYSVITGTGATGLPSEVGSNVIGNGFIMQASSGISSRGSFFIWKCNASGFNDIYVRILVSAGVFSWSKIVSSTNISTIPFINNAAAASSANAGAIRYRVSGNNSYAEMSMQTGASTYAWIPLIQNNW